MAQRIPLGHARYQHRFSLAGDAEPMFITAGISPDGTALDPNAVVQVLHGAMQTVHAGRGSSFYTLTQTDLQLVVAEGEPPAVYSYAANTVGGNAGDAFPSNTAFLIKKRSAKGGRRNQGRWFYPGVNEGNVDSLGQVAAAVVTSWNSLLAQYLLSVQGAAGVADMVIFHELQVSPLLDAPTAITSLKVDGRVATQRQRLRR